MGPAEDVGRERVESEVGERRAAAVVTGLYICQGVGARTRKVLRQDLEVVRASSTHPTEGMVEAMRFRVAPNLASSRQPSCGLQPCPPTAPAVVEADRLTAAPGPSA